MTDFTDIQLIEHIAGRGEDDQRRRIDHALADSPQLKARYDQLAATWALLGRDDREPEPRDLWVDIETTLNDADRQPAVLVRIGGRGRLRAAAALLLAVGIGHLAGRYSLPDQPLPTITITVAEAEADVQAELELDALTPDTLFSFATDNLLDPDPDTEHTQETPS